MKQISDLIQRALWPHGLLCLIWCRYPYWHNQEYLKAKGYNSYKAWKADHP